MSSNYLTFLTYLNLLNTFNMTCNLHQNHFNSHIFFSEPSLMGSAPSEASTEAPKTTNTIVLSSDDDDNSTPKTRSKLNKSSIHSIKRTHSQLTDKTIQRKNSKSVLNSNFSLEDQPEPESAETDFNSPIASSSKHQASKLKQKQRLSASSKRKISQTTLINSSSSCQLDNTIRKKSFFEELEEIAFSFMTETQKKAEELDNSSQTQLSVQQSSSSNLITLYPSLMQSSSLIQSQSQQPSQQQFSHSSKQLDHIKEEEDESSIHSHQQSLITQKRTYKRAAAVSNSRAAPQKKQTKINQKSKQREKKIIETISNNATNINYQNNISLNNNQSINCANAQINFPIQPKPILLNSNSNNQIPIKFQQQPIKKLGSVYAEEVYLKSISQEGSIKLQKFPCFRESDLQIPNEFTQLIQQCSGDELLEKAVNYMHKKLVASTIEQNSSAVIPDAEKTFTINDIKLDRDSDEEEEEEENQDQGNQYSTLSNYHHSQYSPYNRQQNNYQNKNNFLSDDEEDEDYQNN